MKTVDMAIIGAGPAGAATAIRAARQGVDTVVFDRAPYGRDKACGDGLTPRAVGALAELGIDLGEAHMIEGLRMIAGSTERVLPWPETSRFPAHGAVWPRRALDAALIDAAAEAGAEIIWNTEALPVFDGEQVVGVEAGGESWTAGMVVAAGGAPGKVARMLGATGGRRGALRGRHPQLRCFASPCREVPGGLPHHAGRKRQSGSGIRVDIPRR